MWLCSIEHGLKLLKTSPQRNAGLNKTVKNSLRWTLPINIIYWQYALNYSCAVYPVWGLSMHDLSC